MHLAYMSTSPKVIPDKAALPDAPIDSFSSHADRQHVPMEKKYATPP